jgi:peptidoglycan hydrolase CwlO-like protein
MKRLAILALSLALVATYGSAQESGSGDKQDPTPTPAQLEEMKRSLEAQQKEIERLKQEAREGDRALEEMQKQVQDQQRHVQDQLKQTEAAAQAADAAAKAAEAAKSQPVRQAPEDMNLQPATAGQPGVYNASIAKSIDPMLQQPNPATGVVTPPWAVLKIADNVMFRFGTLLQPS